MWKGLHFSFLIPSCVQYVAVRPPPGPRSAGLNPAAAFRPARCVRLRPEGQGLIILPIPAELKMASRIPTCTITPISSWPLVGLKLALRWPKLPPSCLLLAILPPMLPASCLKMPPKRAPGRQDAILGPSWPRLGSQNGSFVWEGLLFSAYRLFCLKIA